ncbi:MAG: selenium-binding protein, partial [Proteobacteria bacterium]|nr:selenium-binding protein [Pseudomonadota bacterium]
MRTKCTDRRKIPATILSLSVAAATALAAGLALHAAPALADETCNSPYVTNLIKGQEDYVHVWTLGVKGMGDESDKLVTVDVNP